MNLSKYTVGILGGMGPAATANFLRLLVKSFNEIGISTDSDFPKMIMLSIPLEDWDNTGSLKKASVRSQIQEGLYWLSRQEVDVIAAPCNTIHEFIPDDPRVVDIILSTLDECFTFPAGILCSRQTLESDLYGRKFGTNNVHYFADQNEVDDIIANAMAGEFEDISDLIDQALLTKVKIVVLGCTELSLCSNKHNAYQVPIIDSAAALARATVRRVVSLG